MKNIEFNDERKIEFESMVDESDPTVKKLICPVHGDNPTWMKLSYGLKEDGYYCFLCLLQHTNKLQIIRKGE